MISADRLREVLQYDPETGIFVWRVRLSRVIKVGQRAGTIDNYGYSTVQIDRRHYKLHRLAWLYVTGLMPCVGIDHINGIRDDNRLSNLREATASQNVRNSHRHVDNQSGFKGVYRQKHTKKNPWRAQITFGGRTNYLGGFPTAELAHSAYVAAAKTHFGEFARGA